MKRELLGIKARKPMRLINRGTIGHRQRIPNIGVVVVYECQGVEEMKTST